MTGRAQLSDEQQIEIRFQRGCDLECDGNAATGQGQNKRMLVRKMPKSARKLLPCVLSVTKDHRSPSNHRLMNSGTGESFNMSRVTRSEEHTSELQSLMRISYAVFCLKKKKN